MTITWDPITVTNTVLCIIILVLGCVGYGKSRDLPTLLIGIAFGIFGFSHVMTLLGLKEMLTTLLIIVRTIAYIMVVVALYLVAFRRK